MDRERSFQWVRQDIKATSMGHQNPFHVSEAGERRKTSFEGSPPHTTPVVLARPCFGARAGCTAHTTFKSFPEPFLADTSA